MNKPVKWSRDAKSIGEMPIFAGRSAFWRELKSAANDHLAGCVRAVAQRHGLPCHDLGGVLFAVKQHFVLLKTLGGDLTLHPSTCG